MSDRFKGLYRLLCLSATLHAMGPVHAATGVAAKVGPSDCRPRDADSTCATAVAGAPTPSPMPIIQTPTLYDGPLGGVPSTGYAYWGFDFFADETGLPSLVRPDEFINRSSVPVTIVLTFDIPTDHPCNKDCLPGVQFQVDAGFHKVDPPYTIVGGKVSLAQTFATGRGYGWVIGLWQATNPRLTVTVPKGATATLEDVGLSPSPAVATQLPAIVGVCDCPDGSSASCSAGTRYSNGLLGPWYQISNNSNYQRSGSFNDCPAQR